MSIKHSIEQVAAALREMRRVDEEMRKREKIEAERKNREEEQIQQLKSEEEQRALEECERYLFNLNSKISRAKNGAVFIAICNLICIFSHSYNYSNLKSSLFWIS